MARSRKKRKLSGTPTEMKANEEEKKRKEGVSPLVEKYWHQRYDLFRRYDEGVRLDEEGWFSVTHEKIAVRHALRSAGCGVVIDGFSGVGGNTIQFAALCDRVVAIDIDPKKIELAINNAKVYGVEEHIDFVVGDFFQLASSLKADVVFLSPPWGGPSYKLVRKFTLDSLKPKDGFSLFRFALTITPNIIMYLPRNIDLLEVEQLSWLSSPPLDFEIEENTVHGHLKGITVYFGDAASARPLLFSSPTDRVEVDTGYGTIVKYTSKRRPDLTLSDRARLINKKDFARRSSGVASVKVKNGELGKTSQLQVASLPASKNQVFQVVVMRVSLHCPGYTGKVKKHLSKMDGVTSFSIELESKRVIVRGYVSPLVLVESISKVKKAELWPSSPAS